MNKQIDKSSYFKLYLYVYLIKLVYQLSEINVYSINMFRIPSILICV